MAQKTVRLDDCEEEESEVTREARAGRGRREEEKEETRGQEADEEKMEKDVSKLKARTSLFTEMWQIFFLI